MAGLATTTFDRLFAPAMPATPTCADIFRQHGAMVFRCLRRLGVPDRDLDDVTQEVFVAVHRGLGGYEERGNLRGWLYTIAVREAARYARRRPPVAAALEGVDTPSAEPSPEAELATKQARADFDRILAALDEPRRAVFVLYELDELPMSEVAAAVGCPLQTAYSRHRAAREIVLATAQRIEAHRSSR